MPIKNELGNVFSHLTVIAAAPTCNGKAAWTCQCSCGTLCTVTGDGLRQGKTKSCGCFRRTGVSSRTHGHASYAKGVSRTYKSWQEMRARCNNPSHISFKNYGARGITYPAAWDKFEAFLADVGERPPKTSLDRIKNHLGYSKKNCCWSSRRVQNNTRRNVVLISYQGKRQSLARWCEELSVPYPRTYDRITRQGMTFRDAVTQGPLR